MGTIPEAHVFRRSYDCVADALSRRKPASAAQPRQFSHTLGSVG